MSWQIPFPIAPSGHAVAGDACAVSRFREHLDVFWVGPDGGIGTTWWNAASGWAQPFPIAPPGHAMYGAVSVVSRFREHLDVFWIGPDRGVGTNWWDESASPPTVRLNFVMQQQTQTNWCWAATSASIAAYYDAATTWTQCRVANGELGRGDCCGVGASGPCNVPHTLQTALTRVGRQAQFVGGTVTREAIRGEILANRPMCARTAWSGGGAHFVAISGFVVGDLIEIDDPISGVSDVDYDVFTTSYLGSGTWTHSYYTN
ncbi:MAG: papain-like cysteine protease family protein [Nakamurella sp.]